MMDYTPVTIAAIVLQNALLAIAFALVARRAGPRLAPALHAGLLVVAGVIYVGFAVRAGDAPGVGLEAAGTLLLLTVAFLALRRRSWGLLSAAWALHPLWDVALHTGGAGGYTPFGYVIACVAFDPVLALLIWKGWAGLPRPAAPEPSSSAV